MDIQDCIIVGGGPAGLNAAVVLGRCKRRVLVFDTSTYRNRYSHGMHNYLTRDHILPDEFLKLCHKELQKYGVPLVAKKIVYGRKNNDGLFVVKAEDNTIYYAKKLLIATGLQDTVPDLPGFREFYGKSVFHCPYCDGWENSGKRIGVYAKIKDGWELALALKGWTDHITLYTDNGKKLKPQHEAYLRANDIRIVTDPVIRLDGKDGQIEKVVLKDKEEPCDALFFVNGYTQQCNLVDVFGCEISKKGVVVTNRLQQTNTPGLFVAGDADKDVQFVVVAAAEGAKAGVTINKELQKEIYETNMEKAKPVLNKA